MEQLFNYTDVATNIGLTDILISMTLATLLSMVITEVYRTTHQGSSYSAQLLLTIIIMSVSTSVIMVIIGSNIARAFSLVGALSVIRFRTPIKDSKDTAYIFIAMVIGMGCGTQFYLPSVLFTLFVSGILFLFYKTNYGKRFESSRLLKLSTPNSVSSETITQSLSKYFSKIELMNEVFLSNNDQNRTSIYLVTPKSSENLSSHEIGTYLNSECLATEFSISTNMEKPDL